MTTQPRAKSSRIESSRIESNWVSIDVETAGPDPGAYPLLAIGACLVADPKVAFYVELIPDQTAADPASMAVHGLTMQHLRKHGTEPAVAMEELQQWLAEHVGGKPVMVGFNAPFDWMFISQYFWYYLGHNPLGHAALDIKALAMGLLRVRWGQTSFAALAEHCGLPTTLTHNALQDAQQQATLLAALITGPHQAPSPPSTHPRSRRRDLQDGQRT
ncbi:MAG: exonuclease domain-containing protein [Actinomycetales bacterium]